jgi:predicted phosphodiesterase
MRIAFVTDIHGNLPALEAVVADFTRRGVSRVVNLGDSLSGPLLPRETAAYLMATGWVHLSGNHERQILAHGPSGRAPSDAYAHAQLTAGQLEWIATLKPMMQLEDDVFICHGSPRSDLEYLLESVDAAGHRSATLAEIDERLGDVRDGLVVCGHTHVPRVVRSPGGALIVNPGSVGQPAFDDDRPFFHTVENYSPHARYAIVERDRRGAWTADLIAVPYAYEPMARLAEERGRPEWALALRTGTVARDIGH